MTEPRSDIRDPGRPPGRTPRWLAMALGIGVIVVGAVLVIRPFQSLALLVVLVIVGLLLTGVSELASAWRSDAPLGQRAVGLAWIAAAIAVATWPGLTLGVLARIVGVALIVSGIARAVAGIRGSTDERVAATLLGLASVIFGLLALAWPDITVFVIGVVFGGRMIIFGVSQVADAMRGDREPAAAAPDEPRSGTGGWTRTLRALGAVAVALALFGISTQLNASAPDPDAFYDAPSSVPSEPGQLLRAEPFTREVPAGARAWRILYTTTRGDGSPALSSGIVVVPDDASAEPHPVIAWAHGTTGVDRSCAPSVLPHPFESGALFILEDVIENGWALVATDYIGLGVDPPHGYLVGAEAGRAVLDAIRAARQLEGIQLAATSVIWGHSQGGGSALWAGTLASSYAPDTDVIGVAALSAASNLPGLLSNLDEMPGGSIFAAYAITGYANAYADVRFDDYVRGSARTLVREMSARCLGEKGAIVSVLESLIIGDTIWGRDPSTGTLGERLVENVPTGPIDAPVFMAQGLADPLVLPDAQAAFVDERCAADAGLEYRTYPGLGHVDIVQADSPLVDDLLQWTRDRLAGSEPISTC